MLALKADVLSCKLRSAFTRHFAKEKENLRLLELSVPLCRETGEQRIVDAVCVCGKNVHVLDHAKPKDHSVKNVELHFESYPRERQLVDADRYGYAIHGIHELRRDATVGHLQR